MKLAQVLDPFRNTSAAHLLHAANGMLWRNSQAAKSSKVDRFRAHHLCNGLGFALRLRSIWSQLLDIQNRYIRIYHVS